MDKRIESVHQLALSVWFGELKERNRSNSLREFAKTGDILQSRTGLRGGIVDGNGTRVF